MVRRTLTEPKTALAGVTLETSFARFMASIATFNDERTPSRRSCRWESGSMVEGQGRGERRCCRQAVRKGPDLHGHERSFFHDVPHTGNLPVGVDQGRVVGALSPPLDVH